MGILKKFGIVKSEGKCSRIFESLLDKPFYEYSDLKPHEYVNLYWDRYKNLYPSGKASINGRIFEIIIQTLFIRENLMPLYLQAKVTFVPNAIFDVLLYSAQNIPYSFSLKTSLRERYKQADLEGIALKYVHRRSRCYLLTMEASEAKSVKDKIANGGIIGLDKAVLCTTAEFDDLIAFLKTQTFVEAGSVEIITTTQVVTKNRIESVINDMSHG